MLQREVSVDQIYNTDPIYICYKEKSQSIRYKILALSTYVTKTRRSRSDIQYRSYLQMLPMRRFIRSDIQFRPYLHILPWEDSVNQIYNTGPIYILYNGTTQSIRYTIPTLSTYITHEKTRSIKYIIPALSTYITMGRLSRSDIQYKPYLHMLPREDSVDQIYNTDPIYLCFNEKTQFIRYTMPTISTFLTKRRLSQSDIQCQPYLHMLPWEDSVNQIYNANHIYISYQEKTQSIRCTMPTISTFLTKRRLSQSDIQYRPYLHMLPREDSFNQIYNTDPIYIYYPWEDSVNQIYNTDPIYICYHEKTQSIRYTTPTLSIYVTERRLSQSDIQYRPYLHMLLWDDSADQMYNTDHINICYREKTQSIR
jgi:hypothetical protein